MNISKQDLAFILVRLLALYFFIVALGSGSLGLFVLTPLPKLELQYSALTIAPFVVWLCASIILWFLAKPLAALMTRNAQAQDSLEKTVDLSDLLFLAFPIIGLLLVTDTLPHLFQIAAYHLHKGPPDIKLALRSSEVAAIVAAITKLILGIVLLVGWQPIAGAVLKLRQQS